MTFFPLSSYMTLRYGAEDYPASIRQGEWIRVAHVLYTEYIPTSILHERYAEELPSLTLTSSPAAADSTRLQCLIVVGTLTHRVTGKKALFYIWFLASRKVVAAEMDRQGRRDGWMGGIGDPCNGTLSGVASGGEDFFLGGSFLGIVAINWGWDDNI